MSSRFWEIDFLRGVAILMMVTFHFLFDLSFAGYNINVSSGFWLYFARTTATLFIFLVGVSLTLSFARAKTKLSEPQLFLKYLKRGALVFGGGLIITLASYIFIKQGYILFGILHLIGLSIILAYPFLKLKKSNLIIGLAIIIVGLYLKNLTFDFHQLLWLGFVPKKFYSLDYFPLLPWFGVVLLGVAAGKYLYPNSQPKIKLPDWSNLLPIKILSLLGQKSLFLYFVHQPIIIFWLIITGLITLTTWPKLLPFI